MASTVNYLDPRVLADLQGLALRTQHVVDGILAGAHRSAHPGSSAEYAHHRPYVPGDDLRNLDWKAFGRTDRLYVKQFMDETDLACTFLLDASGSMGYRGTRSPLSKLEYAGCLVSSLAWLLREQGDAVGLHVNIDSGVKSVPVAASDWQLPEMIRMIESTIAEGHAGPDSMIRKWAAGIGKPHLVVIVSDLFGDEAALHSSIVDLRQFGHEVIVFQICDRDEVEFPFDQLTEFGNMESGADMTLDAELYRDGYLQQFEGYVARVRDLCHRASIDFRLLVSDEPLGQSIGHFLSARPFASSFAFDNGGHGMSQTSGQERF